MWMNNIEGKWLQESLERVAVANGSERRLTAVVGCGSHRRALLAAWAHDPGVRQHGQDKGN
jgi:hypothetical protein